MKKVIIWLLSILLFLIAYPAWAQEISFTLADRDRLIRLEATLKAFKDSIEKRFERIDKRFEQVDKRFEQMLTFMWILASVFGGLVAATIGFAIWDRRTALAPAIRRSRELEERNDRVERALRELAQNDPKIAEALKHVGLL
jgi:hypothetical protein